MAYWLKSAKNSVTLNPVEGTPLDRVIELVAGEPEVEVSDDLGDFLKTHTTAVRLTKKIEAIQELPTLESFHHQE